MGRSLGGTSETASGKVFKIESPERLRTSRSMAFALLVVSLIMAVVICSGFVFV